MSETGSRRRCLTLLAGLASTAPWSAARWAVAAEPPAVSGGAASDPRLAQTLPVPFRSIRFHHPSGRGIVVTAIAIDPAGRRIAVAGDDNRIRILSASTLTTLQTLQGHRDRIRTLAFEAGGERLASAGNDGQVMLYRYDEEFRLQETVQAAPALASVQFAPDGRTLAAVGFDNEVYFFGDGPTGRARLQCECRDLRAVAYRDDNRMLAAAGRSGNVHLFDPATGRLLAEPRLHRGRIHAVVFHRQANVLVSVGEDGAAIVYDTAAREIRHRIKVTDGTLFAAAIVDSQIVAVAGSDNDIHLINTSDGNAIQTLTGHAGTVSTLAAAGGWLLSGSFDATLRRWSLGQLESNATRIAEKDPPENR